MVTEGEGVGSTGTSMIVPGDGFSCGVIPGEGGRAGYTEVFTGMVGPRGDSKAGSPKLRRRVILGQVRAWLVMGGSQAGSCRGGEEV